MDRFGKYAIWAAIVLAALGFAGAGIGKLMGNPTVHASFANLGLPGWFGYFIGVCEVCGAVGLLIRPLSALAAAGLAAITVGALYYHATFPPLAAGIPALVLLVLSIYIFVRRRGDLLRLG